MHTSDNELRADIAKLTDTVRARGEQIRRQQAEIERLVNVLADKNEIIADLQAANAELHERLIAAEARADLARHFASPPMPLRGPPHVCAVCGKAFGVQETVWPVANGWVCGVCREG